MSTNEGEICDRKGAERGVSRIRVLIIKSTDAALMSNAVQQGKQPWYTSLTLIFKQIVTTAAILHAQSDAVVTGHKIKSTHWHFLLGLGCDIFLTFYVQPLSILSQESASLM